MPVSTCEQEWQCSDGEPRILFRLVETNLTSDAGQGEYSHQLFISYFKDDLEAEPLETNSQLFGGRRVEPRLVSYLVA